MPNAIVLVFDRLGSSYLGPYGNTWIETPAWNLLASRSLLVETAMSDAVDLSSLYCSYWHGRHALSPQHDGTVPLVEQLAGQQVDSWLVTDEAEVAQQAAAAEFRERLILPCGEEQEAEHLAQTQLARLFATAIEALEQARPPFLLWVHAQAMQGPWDAPYAMRCKYAEEDDPDPPHTLRPPECWLADDYDPDQLLGYQHAYGGQVSLLDTCLHILLEALWSGPHADSTALLATAARGYPLGEHRYVGRAERLLHAETLQVPWLFCSPDGAGAAWRAQQLLQPPDIYPTLLDWFDVSLPATEIWGRTALPRQLESEPPHARNQAASVDRSQWGIRVPAWFLRQESTGRPHLYVKPDDRWEWNEVANRCQQVVTQLTDVYGQFVSAARLDARHQLAELDEGLVEGLG